MGNLTQLFGDMPAFANQTLQEIVSKAALVGSSRTCAPIPEILNSDIDLLVINCPGLHSDLSKLGFVIEGVTGKYENMVDFFSYRNGFLNIIVANDCEFYNKFILATRVCEQLNLLKKKDRVTVFQAILYGAFK